MKHCHQFLSGVGAAYIDPWTGHNSMRHMIWFETRIYLSVNFRQMQTCLMSIVRQPFISLKQIRNRAYALEQIP